MNTLTAKSTVESKDSKKQKKEEPPKESNIFWTCLDESNWVHNSKARGCFFCQNDFTFIRRRHHCRKCGKIFCNDCVRSKTVAGITAKICIQCETRFEDYRAKLNR